MYIYISIFPYPPHITISIFFYVTTYPRTFQIRCYLILRLTALSACASKFLFFSFFYWSFLFSFIILHPISLLSLNNFYACISWIYALFCCLLVILELSRSLSSPLLFSNFYFCLLMPLDECLNFWNLIVTWLYTLHYSLPRLYSDSLTLDDLNLVPKYFLSPRCHQNQFYFSFIQLIYLGFYFLIGTLIFSAFSCTAPTTRTTFCNENISWAHNFICVVLFHSSYTISIAILWFFTLHTSFFLVSSFWLLLLGPMKWFYSVSTFDLLKSTFNFLNIYVFSAHVPTTCFTSHPTPSPLSNALFNNCS